jgi:hypothetical protein
MIGLRQLQRMLRCAACQGTYLGSAATPCIHLHLTQRAQLVAAKANFACEVKGGARPEPQRASRASISASLEDSHEPSGGKQ